MKLGHITKIYHNKNNDVKALDDISLEILDTGMIFILGPSGSGKSTLLNIINGLDEDYQGSCKIDGLVEYIEQDICLFENMSVEDNLKLVSSQNISYYLEMFEMNEFLHQQVKNLSVGQKKRVQIIRSLLVDYDYLILDEPTASLDQDNTEIIMNVLWQISKNHPVIIISHERTLNEKYADRSIYLKNGQIEQDIVHQKTPKAKSCNSQITYHQNFQFQLKRILESIPVQFIKLIVVLIMTLSLLVFSSFFMSIQGNVEKRNNWLTSKNVIVTQPNDSKTKQGDLYDYQDIQKVKNNVNGVIGYQVGWSASHISFEESFTPPMTLADIKKAVEQEEKDGMPYTQAYVQWKTILDDEAKREKETGKKLDENLSLTYDYRAYEGFTKNEDDSINRPGFSTARLGFFENEVTVYQLFDMKSLDLKYGNLPKENNEVIIDLNTAKQLCKQSGYSSYEELIGKEYNFSLIDLDSSDKVIISGISYQESQHEKRVFFKAGKYDEFLSEKYQFNDAKLKYLYVYFLTDGTTDSQAINSQINQLLDGKYSHFVLYPESVINNNANTVLSYSTLSYVAVALGAIIIMIVYVLVLVLQRKRYNKEIKILKHYHQSILIYLFLPLSIILLLDIIIYSLSFNYLSTSINTYASQLGYSELIQNSTSILVISLIATIVVTCLLEGLFYVYQTKKRSKTISG